LTKQNLARHRPPHTYCGYGLFNWLLRQQIDGLLLDKWYFFGIMTSGGRYMRLHNSQATFGQIGVNVDAIATTAGAELQTACTSCAAVAP
jgi:hypothetical protein